jgi:putative transposon-encoded protein
MNRSVAEILAEVSGKIENIHRDLEKVMPVATIREVSSFGNSGHIVLSKTLLDKRVGVIVLDNVKKNERRIKK